MMKFVEALVEPLKQLATVLNSFGQRYISPSSTVSLDQPFDYPQKKYISEDQISFVHVERKNKQTKNTAVEVLGHWIERLFFFFCFRAFEWT